jgi:DNA primase
MAFPEGFVEEVRRAADIVRVISDHMPLKKMGSSWKGLCPFHEEKTPSFNVRQEPPVFHCFGCGEGGDVFKFLMLREKMSFPETLEALARQFGVPIPEGRFEPGPDRKERDALLALLEAAATHFTRTLQAAPGQVAREYLRGRGFANETLERIRAGAARDSWDDLLGALRGRYSATALQKAGLVLPRKSGEGHYDRFRNRAVFPILDEGGKVVAFGARSLDGSEPKYLNSPESPVYHKGRVLYGLSWAREAIRREKRVVLMEGYLDVARALECGVEEAVATCGTALTPSHGRLLRRFAETVCVNFDQDEAGQRAARKSLEVLLGEGLRVRVVELPEGHDPDSFLRAEGGDAYRRRLEEAPEALEWLMRRAEEAHDVSSPEGKARFLGALLPALVRVENAVERSAWLTRAVERARLDEAAAREELRRALGGRGTGGAGVAEAARRAPAPKRATALLPAERWLLALIVTGAEGIDEAFAELGEADIDGLRTAPLLRAAKALWRREQPVTMASLTSEVGDDAAGRLLSEIAVEGVPGEGLSAMECVKEIRRQPLKARMADVQKRLQGAEGESLEALLNEKTRLVREIAGL